MQSPKRIVCDIETDSLEPTKIWLIVCEDADDPRAEPIIFRHEEGDSHLRNFRDFYKKLTEETGEVIWIGHNFLSFDGPVLQNFTGNSFKSDSIIDTLILGRLLRPGLENSLEKWGEIVGDPKLEFDQFHEGWSPEMEEYCIQDVKTTKKVFHYQMERLSKGMPEEVIRLEHDHQAIMNRQYHEGFQIRKCRAQYLLSSFEKRLKETDERIHRDFKPTPRPVRSVHTRAKRDGTLSLTGLGSASALFPYLEPESEFTWIEWQEFNPGSPKQIVERLEPWWNPVVRTAGAVKALRDRRTPEDKRLHFERYGWKINEENLSTVSSEAPEAVHHLRKRAIYAGRINKLKELIDATGDDSRVHGGCVSLGATSHRAAHYPVNMANLPGEQSEYGGLVRSLLGTSRNGSSRILGVDAAGIQYRIFAHLTGDDELIEKVAFGKKEDGTDVHSFNWKLLQPIAKNRSVTKNLLFGYIIAHPQIGVPKVMELLECTRDEAKEVLSIIRREWPSIMETKRKLVASVERYGMIKGLDGRLIPVIKKSGERDVACTMSTHLQSGEAIVMKWAQRWWVEEADRLGLRYKLCTFVHDEWQTEVHEDDVEKMAELQTYSIKWAGEELGCLCPLEGEARIGFNWKETH